jgi:hypothetical protein
VGFVVGAWVHRGGLASRVPAAGLHDPAPLGGGAVVHHGASQPSAPAFSSASEAEIIDVDYRVVS